MNITGRQIALDDKRSVFVGRSEDDDLTYIKFENHEGEATRIKISQEARAALLKLLVSDGVLVQHTEGQWIAVFGDQRESK